MEFDKSWRPKSWPGIIKELLNTPIIWGGDGPQISHTQQIIEETANRILEEFIKAQEKPEGAQDGTEKSNKG